MVPSRLAVLVAIAFLVVAEMSSAAWPPKMGAHRRSVRQSTGDTDEDETEATTAVVIVDSTVLSTTDEVEESTTEESASNLNISAPLSLKVLGTIDSVNVKSAPNPHLAMGRINGTLSLSMLIQ